MLTTTGTPNPVIDEIKALAQEGWPRKATPHLKLANLHRRFLAKEKQLRPGTRSVVKEFAFLLGKKSYAWASNYEVLARVDQDDLKLIGHGGDYLRLPLPEVVDLVQSGCSKDFFTRLASGVPKNNDELSRMLASFMHEARQRNKKEEERPGAVNASQSPPPPPPPAPKPPPIRYLPPEEEVDLEALRAHFSMSMKSVRIGARKRDLDPITQPKGWDPEKVRRSWEPKDTD